MLTHNWNSGPNGSTEMFVSSILYILFLHLTFTTQVLPKNLKNQKNSPNGDGTDALDQPGLKDMTLKAIDILQARAKPKNTGWFMMSEAASIDKVRGCAMLNTNLNVKLTVSI